MIWLAVIGLVLIYIGFAIILYNHRYPKSIDEVWRDQYGDPLDHLNGKSEIVGTFEFIDTKNGSDSRK